MIAKVRAELYEAADAATGCPELLALCERLCRWEMAPTSWCGGRAGWHEMPASLASEIGAEAIKLKGLGQAPSDEGVAALPADEPYDRWPGQAADPHFGIGADLEFVLLPGTAAPLGGISLEAALQELRCAQDLSQRGVPAVTAVAVFSYPGRVFTRGAQRVPLGVVVTASPVRSRLRCSAMLPQPGALAQAERARVAAVLGMEPESPALALTAAAYRSFGAALRGFSAAGWFRYSGHPDNFVLDQDGRAVLVDLDSCRQMSSVSTGAAALESVRDAMSALYNLMCSFFRPALLDAISDDELIACEPFSAFLDGWDPASAGANAVAGRAIARYAVASREQLRHFGAFLWSGSAAGEHLYRYVRHDRDLTFIWLYRLAYTRRCERPAALPMPFGLAELDERLLRFAGRPRFEKMHDLLSSEFAAAPAGIPA